MKVIEVHEVSKSNSSYGSWAVYATVEISWPNLRTTRLHLFYWHKSEALAVKAGDHIAS